MPQYTTLASVKARLVGKVQFTTDANIQNKMQESLALELIADGEAQVELDLSPRYATPLYSDAGSVPIGSKNVLKMLADLQSCMRILETDFGSGSATNGDKYKDALQKRYDASLKQLLAKKKDGSTDGQGWMYPPLPGVALMWGNSEGDDGYSGMVIVANGSSSQGYAGRQVNDPSQSLWGYWDEDTY